MTPGFGGYVGPEEVDELLAGGRAAGGVEIGEEGEGFAGSDRRKSDALLILFCDADQQFRSLKEGKNETVHKAGQIRRWVGRDQSIQTATSCASHRFALAKRASITRQT